MKKNTGKVIRIILLVVASLLLVFCLFVIFVIQSNYKKNNSIYDNVKDEVLETVADREEQVEGVTVEETEEKAEGEVVKSKVYVLAPITVDFDTLIEQNPDTIGWIYCAGTEINYPILYSGDNKYYVDHAFDGTETKIGAIFVDGNNNRGFMDGNIIVYGHNMKDGGMMNDLANYLEQDFYDTHPNMWILTPEGDYKMEVFSGYLSHATDFDALKIFGADDPTLLDYVKYRKELSSFQCDVELEPNAHYVMISTCNYYKDMGRFFLHGKLVPVDSAGGKLME